MKPYIYFEEKDEISFEGVRLRKNLKGALELAGVNYAPSFLAMPDILHIIAPVKEAIIEEAKEIEAKIVVSALYGSRDKSCTFLENGKNGPELTKAGSKTLEAADLIFVPNEACKNYLIDEGIETPITSLTPGVNLSRFDNADDVEKEVFSRYSSLRENQKYIISCGDYKDIEAIRRLSMVAKEFPEIRFFYFGLKNGKYASANTRRRYSLIYGRNITFMSLVEDDVYRSGMSGALAYLSLSSLPDFIPTLEAMSAKVPVFEIARNRFGNLSIDGRTGNVCENEREIVERLTLLCQNEGKPTIIEAYDYAKKASLRVLGEKLVQNYESILNAKEQEND